MILQPAVHLSAHRRGEASASELALRYAAATAATLLAIAGAQLVVGNSLILTLVCLTLLGVPISVYLRQNEMKIGSYRLSRPLWNGLTVCAAFAATGYLLFVQISQMLLPFFHDEFRQQFWMRFRPEDFLALLMQAFLLFAAFRSFALISDKDATLCTVPSFSVLLLLIPVHKGIEVVFYFLAWTMVAAILFALDHRSELRSNVTAFVPPARPGQDVRMGARSLASILAISLVSAAGISYFLTARDVSEQSRSEIAIADLAGRLTKFALSIPDLSSNNGSTAQIDFSSSPPLPPRAELWQVNTRVLGGDRIRPLYWRMVTLNNYDGSSWSEGTRRMQRLKRTQLNSTILPPRQAFRRSEEISLDRQLRRQFMEPRIWNGRNLTPSSGFDPAALPQGFVVAGALPEAKFSSGERRAVVRQDIVAVLPTSGFLPVLPEVRAIQVNDDRKDIRLRSDGAISFGVMNAGDWLRVISDVPAVPEYGFHRSPVPPRSLSAKQIAASRIALSPTQRSRALQLPTTLPARVRALGREVLGNTSRPERNLRGSNPRENNFRRAQRLALALQQNATYTLHPPRIPEGRDATDFFLFEGRRRGYCTYFAGALTVLCRSQGIPARVVSGFINTDSSNSETTVFRAANAHAWTEVWVEGWGWAVVDATPTDDRGENSPTWVESWQSWISSSATNAQSWIHSRLWPIVLVSLLLSVVLATRTSYFHSARDHFLRAAGADDTERRLVIETYRGVSRRMTRRFRPRSASETPDEWLQNAASALSPADAESLRRLTALYTAAIYAHRPLPPGSAELARRTAADITWRKIRS